MKPRAWRALIAYDGTGFAGFQVQTKQPVRTVQGELEKAVKLLTGEHGRVTGASRTDAGVHALGQVVSFKSGARIPEERWAAALNSVLPEDIRVLSVSEVTEGFHPRFDAKRKTYRYVIIDGPGARGAVLWRRYAWLVGEPPLDVERMREAAAVLVGTHDFSSFKAAGSAVKNPVRTVTEARWEAVALGNADLLAGAVPKARQASWQADEEAGSGAGFGERAEAGGCRLLTFVISADGFLYNMVRNLVGTMVEVGRGKRSVADFRLLLEARNRKLAGPTAPAHALCLVRVEF